MNPAQRRLKVLEAFINKALEINARRACQDETPMTFKESCDLAKEYLDSPSEFSRETNINQHPGNQNNSANKGKGSDQVNYLKGIKTKDGKWYCLHYNTEKGCNRGKACSYAHKCGYLKRGEKEPCGKDHPRPEH